MIDIGIYSRFYLILSFILLLLCAYKNSIEIIVMIIPCSTVIAIEKLGRQARNAPLHLFKTLVFVYLFAESYLSVA